MEWLEALVGSMPLVDIGGLLERVATFPLPIDIRGVIESLGVEIRCQRELSPATSGYLYRGPVWPVVVLNANDSPARRRFTMAHELCHWLNNDADLCFKVDREDEFRYSQTERRADRFAAEILMPTDPVRGHWSRHRSAQKIARDFVVSQSAALLRLYDLELVGAEGTEILGVI